MTITFCVSNNDGLTAYTLGRSAKDNPKCAVVYSEASAFNFPSQTTTFLCPQITPMMDGSAQNRLTRRNTRLTRR